MADNPFKGAFGPKRAPTEEEQANPFVGAFGGTEPENPFTGVFTPLRAQQLDKALDARPVQSFNEAMAETQLRMGPDAAEEIQKSTPAKRTLRNLDKSARLIAAELSEPERSALLEKLKTGGQYARSGMETFLYGLDTPRRETMKRIVGGTGDAHDVEQRIAASDSPVAKAVNFASDVGGHLLAAATTLPAMGFEAALDDYKVAPFDERAARWKTFAQGMMTDPLTYLTLGLGSGSAKAMTQMERALAGAKVAQRTTLPGGAVQTTMAALPAARVDKAAKLAGRVFERYGGTPRLGRNMNRVYRAAGGTDPAALEAAMGRNAEFAGLSGVEVGLPFGPKVELAGLGAKLGLPAHATRRALKPVGQAIRALPGPLRQFEGDLPTRQFVERESAKARHRTMNATNEAFRTFEEKIAPLAPMEPGRRKELIQYFVDPDYVTGPNGWVRAHRPPAHVQPPTPGEQKWMDELDVFFDAAGRELQANGIIEVLERNAATGRYVPRQFLNDVPGSPWVNALRNWFDKATKPSFPGMKSNPLKKRTSDTPLGRAAAMRIPHEADPHVMVADYIPRTARALEGERFRKAVTRELGPDVPPEVLGKFDKMFEGKRLPFFDKAQSIFKESQLSNVPRFHVSNAVEDIGKMAAAGMDAKAMRLVADVKTKPSTHVLGVTPAGRTITVGDFLKQSADNGFTSTQTAHDFDFANSPREWTYRFNREAEKAAGVGVAGRMMRGAKERPGRMLIERAQDVGSLGLRPLGKITKYVPGRKMGEAWEHQSKMALYLDGLLKGMPENVAAKRVSDTLFDTAIQGPTMRALRHVVPFGGYNVRSAKAVPRLIASNPKVATTQMRVAETLAAKPGEEPDELPEYVRERGMVKQLGPDEAARARGLVNAIAASLPGETKPVNPGLGVAAQARGFVGEGLTPMLEAAGGNLDPVRQMMGPFLAPVVNWDYNPVLKRAYEEPFDPARPFAPGTPGVPTELQAFEGAPSWSMYAAPFVPRPGATALNIAGRALGAPGPVVGVNRPYSDDANQRQAAELLSLMFGFAPWMTNPMQIQREAARKVEGAAGISKRMRREERDK